MATRTGTRAAAGCSPPASTTEPHALGGYCRAEYTETEFELPDRDPDWDDPDSLTFGQLFDEQKSKAQRYADLVIGQPGWLALLKHELITLLCWGVPGALGLVLPGLLRAVVDRAASDDVDAVVLQTNATQRAGGREVRKPLRPAGEGGGL